ncbi:hypothetical protein CONLIGDRAFT_716813 [Coniochaeta ligniaria NRRL 30616]|uniref:Osmotin, thaumatin-like protein n=1 Tax=Coniochaeta ligniaria NRRL 30616 TaxID=1408157 RepID=A0A1J7IZP0_9PEZI|nr:hypothetical protein CONLIGDRAFT_716813 [Coniochaeta ligniaria NRRL 30616]
MAPVMSTMKTLSVLALITMASAGVVINNGCPETVHIDQVAGVAPGSDGALPSFDLAPGESMSEPLYVDPHGMGSGTSVKISRESGEGVLQLEYTLGDHLYWDLSDLDGGGAGVVVSPFRDSHVRVTPTGDGAGEGENKCWALDCPAGQTCQEAYQEPDQEATRVCPADTGDLILDLCLDGGAALEAPASGDAPETEEASEEEEDSAGQEREWEDRKMVRGRRII